MSEVMKWVLILLLLVPFWGPVILFFVLCLLPGGDDEVDMARQTWEELALDHDGAFEPPTRGIAVTAKPGIARFEHEQRPVTLELRDVSPSPKRRRLVTRVSTRLTVPQQRWFAISSWMPTASLMLDDRVQTGRARLHERFYVRAHEQAWLCEMFRRCPAWPTLQEETTPAISVELVSGELIVEQSGVTAERERLDALLAIMVEIARTVETTPVPDPTDPDHQGALTLSAPTDHEGGLSMT